MSSTEINLEEKNLQIIRGLPLFAMFKKDIVEEILDFVPDDGDVIIATYPKTGTTWVQYIVHQIMTKGESFPAFNDMLYSVMPFLEMSGLEAVKKLTTRPRVYKHHFPYDMVQKNPKAKVIYVYRKPEDTIVSYYYFMNNVYGSFMDLDVYFEDFMSGNVGYGHYFDHVLSYFKHKEDDNLLLVSYEKLLIDKRNEILRLAKFLDQKYLDLLLEDQSVLDKIMEHTEFSYMKKNLYFMFPKDSTQLFSKDPVMKEVTFFRKGVKGDGKNLLNELQLTRLTELAKVKLNGTDVINDWLEE